VQTGNLTLIERAIINRSIGDFAIQNAMD